MLRFRPRHLSRIARSLVVLAGLSLVACQSTPPPAPTATLAPATKPAAAAQPTTPASAPKTGAPAAAPSGVLRVAMEELGSEKFNPRMDVGASNLMWSEMFEMLMGVDVDGHLDNSGLAERWEIGPGGNSITFFLKKGVLWHDGVEFTADDVKFTTDTYYRTEGTLSPAGGFVTANIQSVATPDRYTATFSLKVPVAPIMAEFGPVEGFFSIMPKHQLEAKGVDAAATEPIGTGPWKFSNQKAGEYVEMEANTAYRDATRIPRFKTAHVIGVKEASTRASMLRSGQVDIAQVDTTSVPALIQAGIEIKPLRYGATTVGAFMMSYDPSKLTNKLEFRKALNLAIDRKAIFESMYPPGTAEVLKGSGIYAPGALGDDPNLQPYPYDPEEARKLLAGVYKGEQITLWSYSLGYNPEQPDVNELIQGYWTKVGLKVDIQKLDYASFRPRVGTQDFPRPVETGVFAPATRPSMVSQLRIYLNKIQDGGTISIYHDQPKAKLWYDELIQISDPKALENRLLQINRELYNEYWSFPLFAKHIPYASNKQTIASWDPGALRRVNTRLWSAVPAGG